MVMLFEMKNISCAFYFDALDLGNVKKLHLHIFSTPKKNGVRLKTSHLSMAAQKIEKK